MKLRTLRLQNYRVHTDSTLDAGDAQFLIIRGKNMSGKTSFAEALSMNLAQTTVSLDGQGKGFTDKIAQGQSKAIITAEIQGTHLLKNTVTLNTNTSGRANSVECLDEPDNNKIVNGFNNFLKDRKEALLISMNTDYFNRLDKKEQTNLLAKLVLPSRYDFPDDKMDAVTDILGEGKVDFDAEPFTVITGAYKLLYKERETINRQVKEFTIPDTLPVPKGIDSASLQTELAKIKEQRTKIQTERDAAVAKANEVEVKRATLQTKLDGLRKERERSVERLDTLESYMLTAEKMGECIATAGKADELAKLKSDHSALRGTMGAVTGQIKRLKEIAEEGATCPVCDQTIDGDKIAVLVTELEAEVAQSDKRLQELDTKIEAIGDINASKELLKKHEAAVKEKIELESSLTKVVKTGKETKAALEALPEAANATLQFNDPLIEIQAKEDKVNEQLRPVMAAEERASEITRLTAQKEKLLKKAASLDSLVKYFDKDGVKKTLIESHIGGFENKLKEVMSAWGYECSLSEDLRFEVKTARGYVGPVKEISGAEEHIFKAAFQCAVSIAAGINMVVIDEVEELGEDIRPFLYQKVFQLIQDNLLDQAIMIGFSLDKNLPKPQAPGSKYFFVSEGTVEELR